MACCRSYLDPIGMNFLRSRRRTGINMRIGTAIRVFPFSDRALHTIARSAYFGDLNLAVGDGLSTAFTVTPAP